MEKRKSKKLWRIPGFMQDRRMRLIALFILGLAIVSDGLAFFISPIVGIIVLVLPQWQLHIQCCNTYRKKQVNIFQICLTG